MCIHYADSCWINLDNWNILQQYNWNNFARFFLFSQWKQKRGRGDTYTTTSKSQDQKSTISRFQDQKTATSRIQDQKTPTSRFQDIFSENKKPRHRDSKTEKPRHRVPVELWPLCPLIFVCGSSASTWGPEKCYRYTVNEYVCSLSTVLNSGTLSSKNALPVYRHLICL